MKARGFDLKPDFVKIESCLRLKQVAVSLLAVKDAILRFEINETRCELRLKDSVMAVLVVNIHKKAKNNGLLRLRLAIVYVN